MENPERGRPKQMVRVVVMGFMAVVQAQQSGSIKEHAVFPFEGWRYSFVRRDAKTYLFRVERLTHRPWLGEGDYGNYVEVDLGVYEISLTSRVGPGLPGHE